MNNLIILPIVIPAIIGALLVFFAKSQKIQRFISVITMTAILFVSIWLSIDVYQNGIQVIALGDWPMPFGIPLVADMFATVMILLSSVVGIFCLFFAFRTIHPNRERFYFYPFYFFLIAGVNGTFLTGDLFNLFVFFEVTLIASYILIVHGSTAFQLRESFKYLAMNVFASMFFVVGVAYIYATTGTMNIAHIGLRVEELGQEGVLNVVAIVLLFVFAMKGALFPLYFWLPRSYTGPPAVVSALFVGLLTKIGIYAIIRVFTVIFNHEISFTHNIILILAGLTMLVGVLGAVAKYDFKSILAYHSVSQVGYMVMGLGIFTPLALAGAIYFMVHHSIVKAGLFLFSGVAEKITGTTDIKQMGGLLKTHPAFSWLFFVTAMSLAGIPPLAGFFGKFTLIVPGLSEGHYVVVAVSLIVGLLTLFSMMKIFSYSFWGRQKHSASQAKIKTRDLLVAISPFVVTTIAMGLAAEPIFSYFLDMAHELLDPSIYIESVLEE
ncbi:Na+/H+ antiporter subunit D [Natribacillus halophilus]|uniref:Multisubunit sodium/proton antiporter, MrpD subunit n=1 Tax=Natribacillus halophilus TaxID=549003 RepID=A0A1G8JV17_9BACI|nr:Na+/H+ antiporter subunit D [Natribacillus halophilus]SDI35052.1 multisubunit sodium/proton antiporter, MrpD subunit [Natribacillus halophilus]